MENKLAKIFALCSLIIVWSSFFFSSYKDSILLGFLLFLSGVIFKTKKETSILLGVFVIFFIINLLTEVNDNDQFLNKSLFLLINFLSNFLLFFFLGLLFKNVFKKNPKFIRLSTVWISTFIISQLCVTFIDKEFISRNNYLVGVSFFSCYFVSGYYISKNIANKLVDIVKYNILPLIIIPLILVTSQNSFEAILYDVGIIFFSMLGFITEHLVNHKKISC